VAIGGARSDPSCRRCRVRGRQWKGCQILPVSKKVSVSVIISYFLHCHGGSSIFTSSRRSAVHVAWTYSPHSRRIVHKSAGVDSVYLLSRTILRNSIFVVIYIADILQPFLPVVPAVRVHVRVVVLNNRKMSNSKTSAVIFLWITDNSPKQDKNAMATIREHHSNSLHHPPLGSLYDMQQSTVRPALVVRRLPCKSGIRPKPPFFTNRSAPSFPISSAG
jgi:hypothetical protein